jgi:hypothetical protein
MDNSKAADEIGVLVDKYFTERIKTPLKKSDSIIIRKALNKRINGYFPKSLLNEILIKKGFLYKIESDNNYYFNISHKDIRILANSQAILNRLSEKNNWTISDNIKLHKFKNLKLYKYKFRFIIKYKFHSDFFERNYSEIDIYNVIAKELGIGVLLAKQYIETFNSYHFPEIPADVLVGLLRLFDITKKECLTDNK